MKPRILIVDDEWSMLELLRVTFAAAGLEVVLAKNDIEFKREALIQRPDVIILDLMLGEKNGMDVYEALLNEGFDPKVPVVFLSALAGDRPAAPLRAGRTYALHGKPFDPEKLVAEINTILKPR
ncbi:MAG: hypothetical protein A2Y02_02800 [Omnitrophica bacterium GWA2_52_12]|nr:MAG: hypothetical protein A2Y02_02800 [Omnitrophica bacterium GWA2_52_12]